MSIELLALERYWTEAMLVVCSFWAAWALWEPPSNFVTYRGTALWIGQFDADERHWAIFALAAGAAKAGGLVLCLALRRPHIGLTLRCAGLGMSGFFWFGIGLSAMIFNPDSIAAVPLMVLGVSAWWTLLRFPAMPRRAP